MSTKTARKEAEREDAKTRLLAMLKPGDRVYTVLRHVSASGMCPRPACRAAFRLWSRLILLIAVIFGVTVATKAMFVLLR